MGLDTSHDCWHGPYSAFSRWRAALQRAAGWHLEEQRDDRGMRYELAREINWEAVTDANIAGQWETLPEDPLIVLVAHSDCDGQLPVAALLPLAERLEQLAERMEPGQGRHWKWTPGMEGRATYDGEREATMRFAAGLRRAAAVGQPVVFGSSPETAHPFALARPVVTPESRVRKHR